MGIDKNMVIQAKTKVIDVITLHNTSSKWQKFLQIFI